MHGKSHHMPALQKLAVLCVVAVCGDGLRLCPASGVLAEEGCVDAQRSCQPSAVPTIAESMMVTNCTGLRCCTRQPAVHLLAGSLVKLIAACNLGSTTPHSPTQTSTSSAAAAMNTVVASRMVLGALPGNAALLPHLRTAMVRPQAALPARKACWVRAAQDSVDKQDSCWPTSVETSQSACCAKQNSPMWPSSRPATINEAHINL